MRLGGFKITLAHEYPKMQLAPGDYVTPEYRAETDAWLREFFGTQSLMKDGEVLVLNESSTIMVNRATYKQMTLQLQGKQGELK
jgi:hypothetical protein